MFNLNRFIHKYPFETLHEMNLDWIIESVKELAKELEEYEIVNQIHYAGEWNITKQYPSWSVVVSNNDGYISLQPVPIGIDISNTDYWVQVANFTAQLADLGNRMIAAESDIDEIQAGSWLYGKKVAWFGDSVSVFMTPRFIAKYPNTTVVPTVYNGEPLAVQTIGSVVNGYSRLMAADLSTFDYVFIMYGINDFLGSLPLDNANHDEYSFGGALDKVIDHIKSTYKKCVPVVIFPTWVNKYFYNLNYRVNGSYSTIEGYINHGIDICNKNNVEYINMLTITGVNESNYTEMLRDDVDHSTFVHPTDKTLDIMERAIYEHIINTGKAFGENWGGNHVANMIGTLNPTLTEYNAGVKPVLKYGSSILPASLHNMVNTSDNILVFKISGFVKSSGTNAPILNIRTFDIDNQETSYLNVGVLPAGTHEAYFESYVKIPRCEYFSIFFTNIPASPYLIINNFNIQLMNGTEDVYTESVLPTVNATYGELSPNTVNPRIYIKNGMINMESFTIDITSAVSSGDTLVNLPDIFPGQNYGMALKGADEILYVNMTEKYIKALGALTAGNFVTIPASCTPIRSHYTS